MLRLCGSSKFFNHNNSLNVLKCQSLYTTSIYRSENFSSNILYKHSCREFARSITGGQGSYRQKVDVYNPDDVTRAIRTPGANYNPKPPPKRGYRILGVFLAVIVPGLYYKWDEVEKRVDLPYLKSLIPDRTPQVDFTDDEDELKPSEVKEQLVYSYDDKEKMEPHEERHGSRILTWKSKEDLDREEAMQSSKSNQTEDITTPESLSTQTQTPELPPTPTDTTISSSIQEPQPSNEPLPTSPDPPIVETSVETSEESQSSEPVYLVSDEQKNRFKNIESQRNELREKENKLLEEIAFVKRYELSSEEIKRIENRINSIKKQILEMNNVDNLKQRIASLENELSKRNDYIYRKMKDLENGREAYGQAVQIYENLKLELEDTMSSRMKYMEKERQKRLDKLKQFKFAVDSAMTILRWNEENSLFIQQIGELYSVTDSFENKLNNGVSFKNELNYLLNNVPKNFLSYMMLDELKNKIFNTDSSNCVVASHSQLYDRFNVLEMTLRENAMVPSKQTLFSKTLAWIFCKFLFSEQITRNGSSPQTRISRAGYSIKYNDLESCINELEYLDERVLFTAQDWLDNARLRLYVLNTIKLIRSELLGRSVHVMKHNKASKV